MWGRASRHLANFRTIFSNLHYCQDVVSNKLKMKEKLPIGRNALIYFADSCTGVKLQSAKKSSSRCKGPPNFWPRGHQLTGRAGDHQRTGHGAPEFVARSLPAAILTRPSLPVATVHTLGLVLLPTLTRFRVEFCPARAPGGDTAAV